MRAALLRSAVIMVMAFFLAPTIWGQARKGDSMIQNGSIVSFEYTLSDEMGKIIESNKDKEPLTYTHGQGQIIPGLEKELLGMRAGEHKDVKVQPEGGYGAIDPKACLEVPRENVPAEAQKVGSRLTAKNTKGQSFSVRIREIKEKTAILDLNHPWAGKILSFQVKILGVQPSVAK